jgi:hypothetical protein
MTAAGPGRFNASVRTRTPLRGVAEGEVWGAVMPSLSDDYGFYTSLTNCLCHLGGLEEFDKLFGCILLV